MTNETNANELLRYSRTQKKMEDKINYCNGRPNWNGCDYCDLYKAESYDEKGCHCWKQDEPWEQKGRRGCCHCVTDIKEGK